MEELNLASLTGVFIPEILEKCRKMMDSKHVLNLIQNQHEKDDIGTDDQASRPTAMPSAT